MTTDLFDAQPLIIARLNAAMLGFKTVGGPGIIAGIQDIGPFLPACLVFPGDAIRDGAQNWSEIQTWWTEIIVAHENDPATTLKTEAIAGTFCWQVKTSLHGWVPSAGFNSPLKYSDRPDPIYNAGDASFPLRFEIYKFLELR